MKTYAFCMPIVEGTEQEMRSNVQQWLGDMKSEWLESRKDAGVYTERAWIQTTPNGSVLVLAHDVDDLDTVFETFAKSTKPFDVQFRQHIEKVHGVDITEAPAPIVKQLATWSDEQVSSYNENWAIAVPVTNGTFADVKDWAQSVWGDSEFADARAAAGISKQTLCWQETPEGNFCIVYAEGDSMEKAVKTIAACTNDVDKRWIEGTKKFTGLDITAGPSALPKIEKVFDAEIAKPATV